jgi:hypothetical protein
MSHLGDAVVLHPDDKPAQVLFSPICAVADCKDVVSRSTPSVSKLSLLPEDCIAWRPQILKQSLKNPLILQGGRQKPFHILHDKDGRMMVGKHLKVFDIEPLPFVL